MSDFASFVVSVFIFLIKFTTYVISGGLGLVSLIGVWRWPALCASGGKDFREVCVLNFFIVVSDIPVFALGLVGLAAPWRTCFVIKGMFSGTSYNSFYNSSIRMNLISNFFIVLVDIPCFAMFFVLLGTIIRLPSFFRNFSKRGGIGYSSPPYWDSGLNNLIFVEFCTLLLDILFVPFVIIELCSWRCMSVVKILRKDGDAMKIRLEVIGLFFTMLWDIPFLIFGFLVTVTVWRAPRMYSDIKEDRRDWHKTVFIHFCLLCRDIPFFGLFFVILGTLYRLPSTLIRLKSSTSSTLTTPPVCNITQALVDIPEQGGPMTIKIKGTKPIDFVPKAATANIMGSQFWTMVEFAFGKSAATFGKGMMPIKIQSVNQKNGQIRMDFGGFKSGSGEFEIVLMLGAGTMKLRKAFKKLYSDWTPGQFLVHIECTPANSQKCVLLSLQMQPKELLSAAETNQPLVLDEISIIPERVPPFVDSFYLIIGSEILAILTDLWFILRNLGVLALFFVSFAMPWRAAISTFLLLESKDRYPLRKELKIIQMVKPHLDKREEIMMAFQDGVDLALKTACCPTQPLTKHHIQRCRGEKNIKGALIGLFEYEAKSAFSNVCSTVRNSLRSQELDVTRSLDRYGKLVASETAVAFRTVMVKDEALKAAILGENEERHKFLVQGNGSAKTLARFTDKRTQASKELEDALNQIRDIEDRIKKDIQKSSCGPSGLFKRGMHLTREIIVFAFLGGLKDIFSVVGFFVVLGSLYRFPTLMRNLKKEKHDKRLTIVRQLREVFLDIGYAFLGILPILSVYSAFNYLFDVMEDLYVRRDTRAARHTILTYCRSILSDIVSMCSIWTVWKTYKFVLAVLVWGFVTPAEVFSSILSNLTRMRKWSRVRFSVLMWLLYFGLPFIIRYAVAPTGDSSKLSAVLAVYMSILFLAVCFSALSASRGDNASEVANEIRPLTAVSFTWPNLLVVFKILLEAYQLISFTFYLDLPFGKTYNHGAKSAASYSFLSFGATTWESIFWLNLAAVAVWYAVASAPVVIEELMDWRPTGEISGSPLYRGFVDFLSSTIFTTLLVNLFKVLACTKNDQDEWRLDIDQNVVCWSGGHANIALCAMVALSFYITTATAMGTVFSRDRKKPNSDVLFSPIFESLIILSKSFLSLISIFYAHSTPLASLLAAFIMCLFFVIISFVFGSRSKPHICSFFPVFVLRVFGFWLGFWSALSGLVAYGLNQQESDASWVVLIVGWAIGFFVAFSVYGKNAKERKELNKNQIGIPFLRKRIVDLEKAIKSQMFINGWQEKSDTSFSRNWRRTTNQASSPISLSYQLLTFESAIRIDAFKPSYSLRSSDDPNQNVMCLPRSPREKFIACLLTATQPNHVMECLLFLRENLGEQSFEGGRIPDMVKEELEWTENGKSLKRLQESCTSLQQAFKSNPQQPARSWPDYYWSADNNLGERAFELATVAQPPPPPYLSEIQCATGPRFHEDPMIIENLSQDDDENRDHVCEAELQVLEGVSATDAQNMGHLGLVMPSDCYPMGPSPPNEPQNPTPQSESENQTENENASVPETSSPQDTIEQNVTESNGVSDPEVVPEVVSDPCLVDEHVVGDDINTPR